MSAIPLVIDPDFNIDGEFLWFGVILHAQVHVPWTKGVRERFRKSLKSLVSTLGQDAFAFQTPSHDPKKRKFIQDVGGRFHHYRFTEDGEKAEMYIFRPLDLSKGSMNGKSVQT